MKRTATLLAILVITSWTGFPPDCLPSDDPWKKVDQGLFVGEFDAPQKSTAKDSKITIVRVDPKFYSFKLLSASEHGKLRMTLKKWSEEHRLICAVNAGMFQKDGITNVGYMKNFNHINNPRLASTYKTVLAFNPVAPTVPEIQIIDLTCQDFKKHQFLYQTFIQNIRMISCQRENVWSKQEKAFGMAVFGIDKGGNALLIFTESPYSGYDFVNILLSLPISIYNAMYLEGGPQANLYFSSNESQFERIGRYATDQETDTRAVARPIPNVIGIVKKSK
ncbi:MAG: phosphodiester glycosidase family protein [Thermodesulfobacteriota bacterium]